MEMVETEEQAQLTDQEKIEQIIRQKSAAMLAQEGSRQESLTPVSRAISLSGAPGDRLNPSSSAKDRLNPVPAPETDNTHDLNVVVARQTMRRKRRASVEIMATPQEMESKLRWNKIKSGVKMGVALSALTQGVAKERQELDDMKRKSIKHVLQRQRAAADGAQKTCQDGVLHPRSGFRQRWDGLLFFMLLYCAFMIPFRLGFDANAEGMWLIWETLVDVSFLIDVCLTFRTGYMLDEENEDSRVEMIPRRIARNYLKSWFVIDIVSAIPTQLITLLVDGDGADSNASVSKLPRLLRVPKLIRMIRLMKVFRIMRLFKSSQRGIFTNLIEKAGLPPAAMRASRLMVVTIILSHTLACGWFFCHNMANKGEHTWWDKYCGYMDKYDDWAQGLNVTEESMGEERQRTEGLVGMPLECDEHNGYSLSFTYTVSLYWAVTTLTTMGYGDITPHLVLEYIYSTVVMLMGVSFYAYIASNVSIVLSNMDETGSEYRENMEKLSEFMIRKRMTLPLRRRLRKYFHVYWKSRGRVGVYNDVDIVKLINLPALRNDVTTELFREITRQVPYLHDKDPKFIELIAPHMMPLRVAANEYVVKEGERGLDLFWLLKGQTICEYESDNQTTHVLHKCEVGHYFGDIAMFFSERSITSYRACDPTGRGEEIELYMITLARLSRAFKGNADVAQEMKMAAFEKMTTMKAQIEIISKGGQLPQNRTQWSKAGAGSPELAGRNAAAISGGGSFKRSHTLPRDWEEHGAADHGMGVLGQGAVANRPLDGAPRTRSPELLAEEEEPTGRPQSKEEMLSEVLSEMIAEEAEQEAAVPGSVPGAVGGE